MIADGIYRGSDIPESIQHEIWSYVKDTNRTITHSRHQSDNIVENYLQHRNCFKRRYNSNDITKDLLLNGEITQVHIERGMISKAVFCCPYSETKNLIVVIGFWFRKFPCLYCLTAYINFKYGYGIYTKKEKRNKENVKERDKGV